MGESIAEVGYLAGLCGWVSGAWEKIVIDSSHRLIVALADSTVNAGVREGTLRSSLYNAVPGDTDWHDLVDETGPGVLVGLDFISDEKDAAVRIRVDVHYIHCPEAETPQIRTSTSFEDLNGSGGESSWYQSGVYNATDDYYSLFLKRPVVYNTGLLISYQAGTAAGDVGLACQYRDLT